MNAPTKYKVVALLPMKANSERVRGKNFREFCGKLGLLVFQRHLHHAERRAGIRGMIASMRW